MKKIILSVLLMGFAGFGYAQTTTPRNMQTTQTMRSMKPHKNGHAQLNRMKSNLNLTDKQIAKIKALKEKNQKENEKFRNETRKKKLARQAKNEKEMKRILTPAQYQKWQANKDRRRAKMAQRKSQNKIKCAE